jgi:hypothetical protein
MRTYYRDRTPPLAPTRALPGSPEKVAVLRERFRLGQALWHPLDASMKVEPAPDRADWRDAWFDVA